MSLYFLSVRVGLFRGIWSRRKWHQIRINIFLFRGQTTEASRQLLPPQLYINADLRAGSSDRECAIHQKGGGRGEKKHLTAHCHDWRQSRGNIYCQRQSEGGGKSRFREFRDNQLINRPNRKNAPLNKQLATAAAAAAAETKSPAVAAAAGSSACFL
jgi:hypothetical protein